MRKLKDVLRLRLELDLSHRQIARSCHIGLVSNLSEAVERDIHQSADRRETRAPGKTK